MKVFFKYSTHNSTDKDTWFVLGDESVVDDQEFTISPWTGEEAFLRQKFYPADTCSITLKAALSSQESKDTRTTLFKDEYFIIIQDAKETVELMSFKKYKWEEALKIIGMFRGQTFAAATRIWKVKKL